jgi:hypothetical protein
MFSEGSEVVVDPAGLEGESTSVPVVGPASGPVGPIDPAVYDANPLASPRERTDPVGHASGEGYPGAEASGAQAEPNPEDGVDEEDGGRWSLARIARGITGH